MWVHAYVHTYTSVSDIAKASNDAFLAPVDDGGQWLQVWDAAARKLKEDLPGHADEVFCVDWSPSGGAAASGGKDCVLRVWRH